MGDGILAGNSRVGLWLIGARGSVAATVVAGAAAIRAGMMPATGCVSELPDFRDTGLPNFNDLVFGGHDIVTVPLPKRVEQLAQDGVIPATLLGPIDGALVAAETEIRPGIGALPVGQTLSEAVAPIVADLVSFRRRHRLARVVVVNVASTERPSQISAAHDSLAGLEEAMSDTCPAIPTSSLYAYAAFRAGCSYVDFTPSAGARLPALDEFARVQGLPYAGSDGKTGETLVKSALAPMFAHRALRVRSWTGVNLLGGGDGATLAEPAAAQSKTMSKGRALEAVLGTAVEGAVHIDYVPELGEWKTAWDHISFEGFFGVRMTIQFTWQGCDSALAAPLVLDLARLMARAHETGRVGPQGQLAFFFKDPVGTDEHRLVMQYEALRQWAMLLRSQR
ncbi:inositol-3-phosphate synthase [Frankia sp. Cppng1_Ct_nod]|uniref:inositol-3-phosphate synthase n=1 Tax=Frankia sp. Cppng1_Ct_nod TaxID=2897162 RepID=UPI001041A9DF|nr:inositol-3-phosphate synthase [Frankia sp. Cppng1_Ct_nod]